MKNGFDFWNLDNLQFFGERNQYDKNHSTNKKLSYALIFIILYEYNFMFFQTCVI